MAILRIQNNHFFTILADCVALTKALILNQLFVQNIRDSLTMMSERRFYSVTLFSSLLKLSSRSGSRSAINVSDRS